MPGRAPRCAHPSPQVPVGASCASAAARLWPDAATGAAECRAARFGAAGGGGGAVYMSIAPARPRPHRPRAHWTARSASTDRHLIPGADRAPFARRRDRAPARRGGGGASLPGAVDGTQRALCEAAPQNSRASARARDSAILISYSENEILASCFRRALAAQQRPHRSSNIVVSSLGALGAFGRCATR